MCIVSFDPFIIILMIEHYNIHSGPPAPHQAGSGRDDSDRAPFHGTRLCEWRRDLEIGRSPDYALSARLLGHSCRRVQGKRRQQTMRNHLTMA